MVNLQTGSINSPLLYAEFLNEDGNPVASIDNWTNFNFQSDFMTPADTFTLIIEDDRIQELNNQLLQGMAIQFSLQLSNGNMFPLQVGYINHYELTYEDSGHGQQLRIGGHDILGWMGETEALPSAFMTTKTVTTNISQNEDVNYYNIVQLNGSTTLSTINTQINPNNPPAYTATFTKDFILTSQVLTSIFNDQTTFLQAFEFIFSKFADAVNFPTKIVFTTDDSSNIQLKTGGTVGPAAGNKGTAKAIKNAILHLLRPNKKETYLSYALRLAKHLGCNIKASPILNPDGSLTIIISPPVYDREYV